MCSNLGDFLARIGALIGSVSEGSDELAPTELTPRMIAGFLLALSKNIETVFGSTW